MDLQTQLSFMERVKELHYNNVLKFRQLNITDAERLAKIAQRKALYDTVKIIGKIYDDAK